MRAAQTSRSGDCSIRNVIAVVFGLSRRFEQGICFVLSMIRRADAMCVNCPKCQVSLPKSIHLCTQTAPVEDGLSPACAIHNTKKICNLTESTTLDAEASSVLNDSFLHHMDNHLSYKISL